MTWVVVGLFAVATVHVFWRTERLRRAMAAGPRTRRRLSQQMITAAGIWQVSVAAVLVIFSGRGFAISVGGCGLMMIGSAWVLRRLSLP